MNIQSEKETIHIKAAPIVTTWGTLSASFDDALATGEKITSGSIPMDSHAGTASVMHGGKKVTIDVIHDCGASICLSAKGRTFRLNLQAFVDHAIETGPLADKLTFEKL